MCCMNDYEKKEEETRPGFRWMFLFPKRGLYRSPLSFVFAFFFSVLRHHRIPLPVQLREDTVWFTPAFPAFTFLTSYLHYLQLRDTVFTCYSFTFSHLLVSFTVVVCFHCIPVSEKSTKLPKYCVYVHLYMKLYEPSSLIVSCMHSIILSVVALSSRCKLYACIS